MADFERRVAPNLKNTLALAEYALEVSYMGDDAVTHDAAYRCKFELVEDADPPVAVAKDAAIPLASKGKIYRIVIHDNHAAKSTDTSDAGKDILGNGANTLSKPKCYEDNNWIRDIKPAMGLRVTVKKFAAGVQVTLSPDEVLVSWKVLDPEEQLDQVDSCMNPGKPKNFLKEFFKKFKRKSDDASQKGDDNCLDMFGGARKRNGVTDARDVLYQSPFLTGAPTPLTRQPNPSSMPHTDPHRDMLAWSVVNPDKAADGKPIGVSEVFFHPPAICGDNYIFSIGLVTQKGSVLKFKDPDGNEVKEYKTGRFTLWRKVTISLMVTFDCVNENYINWNDVKNAYKAAFIDIVKPVATVKYTQADWRNGVRDYLVNTVHLSAPTVDGAVWNYNQYLLPALPGLTGGNCWTYGEGISRLFLDRAYKERRMKPPARAVEDLDDPAHGNKAPDLSQDETPGLYMALFQDVQAVSDVLGEYMGDREFFMVTVGDATCTFAHELGHAVYIRHSLTRFDGANNVTINNNLTEHTRGAYLEHDQDDAVVCLMSYGNDYYGADGVTPRAAGGVQWHFCAVCLLKLRFWDTVKLRGNKQFRKFIYSKMKPLKLNDVNYNELGAISITHGTQADILCLAKDDGVSNNYGGPYKKNVTDMSDSEWKSSNPARAAFVTFANGPVDYSGRLSADVTAGGSTKIQFVVHTDEMKSNQVTVRIN